MTSVYIHLFIYLFQMDGWLFK